MKPHDIAVKKRTLLIWFGGNLLIALFGILQTFRCFKEVFGVILYFGKHDNKFPNGIESWIMPALVDSKQALSWLFGAFLALVIFNSILGIWVWFSKKNGDYVS